MVTLIFIPAKVPPKLHDKDEYFKTIKIPAFRNLLYKQKVQA